MNQLQSLLQDSLLCTGHVEHAAIIRRKDSSLRASSVGLFLVPEELSSIVKMFRDPASYRSEGFSLTSTGKDYDCLRADKDSIYGKTKDGTSGIILAKTVTFVILATFSFEMHPSICIETVETFAEYFRDKDK